MISLYLFPLSLLLLSGGLIYWNLRSWRRLEREGGDAEELDHGRRQFRRRVQASIMLGLLAVALCLGQLIPARQYPSLYVFFWIGVVLLLMWMVLLAIGDMVVNRQRLARFQRQRRIEEARLQAELKQLRGELSPHTNGQSREKPIDS